jgi:hypothetical protein
MTEDELIDYVACNWEAGDITLLREAIRLRERRGMQMGNNLLSLRNILKPSARFERRKKAVGECLEWTGTIGSGGYGRLKVFGIFLSTHRVAWILKNGPINEGLWVLHKCDNRKCVKVDHLFLGTAADNNRDCRTKGRHKGFRVGHAGYPGRWLQKEAHDAMIQAALKERA